MADKRPTILQIIPELDTGGAELSAVEIADAIVRAGGRALVITADIIGLDYESVAGVRQQITAATGLTVDEIALLPPVSGG